MSGAKKMVIDFVNFIFAISLIGFSILYFTAGDNLAQFKGVLRLLIVVISLIFIFMLRFRSWQDQAEKASHESWSELEMTISFFDRLKIDIFVFSLPVASLLAAFIMKREVVSSDIVSAVSVLIIALIFSKWLLGKAR
jgi:hypothetical protein